MRSLLVVTLLLYGTANYAQVPGYVGKRFGLEYAFNSGVILGGAGTSPLLAMPAIHSAEASFVLSRKVSIAVNYSFSSSKLYLREGYDVESTKFNWNFIGIDFHIYNKHHISPVGNYWSFGYAKGSYKLKSDLTVKNSNAFDDNGNQITRTTIFKSENLGSHRFRVGINKKSIIKGPVYFTGGLNFSLVLTPNPVIATPVNLFDYMSRKLKKDNNVTFKLGLGILL